MGMVRKHLFISGMVQGVGFRYSLENTARRLGVTGWVRNMWDGRVEAVLEGEEHDVQKAVKWCHHGPPGAMVTGVEEKDEPYTGGFLGFEIRYM